jgi:nickel transport protein
VGALRAEGARSIWLSALLLAMLGLSSVPAAAFDLFARHQVSVQFATQDGKPMANAEVRVFAPGEPNRPALTGRTDSEGKFEFGADKDGFWSAEARSGDEVARVMVRVGGQQQQNAEPLSPYWLLGGLFLLLVLAFGYRVARARARRPKR